jgi:hypothetical protein
MEFTFDGFKIPGAWFMHFGDISLYGYFISFNRLAKRVKVLA